MVTGLLVWKEWGISVFKKKKKTKKVINFFFLFFLNVQEVHLFKKQTNWSTTSPCIPYINYKCLKNLGAYEWVAVHVTRHYTTNTSDQGLNISHWSAYCMSHIFSSMCMSRTDAPIPLSKSIFKDPFGHETQARSEDQVAPEFRMSFLQSRRKPRAQPIGSWGSAHAEVSCQWPGEKGAVQRAPYPASLSLQPTHAHAIAPLLSGGCLDAVKSCF